jgi:hypothetical protein
MPIIPDEKCKPALGLRPIERELGIAEPPIRAHLDIRERGTEVVRVQLEKIGQQDGVGHRRHIETDVLGACNLRF